MSNKKKLIIVAIVIVVAVVGYFLAEKLLKGDKSEVVAMKFGDGADEEVIEETA